MNWEITNGNLWQWLGLTWLYDNNFLLNLSHHVRHQTKITLSGRLHDPSKNAKFCHKIQKLGGRTVKLHTTHKLSLPLPHVSHFGIELKIELFLSRKKASLVTCHLRYLIIITDKQVHWSSIKWGRHHESRYRSLDVGCVGRILVAGGGDSPFHASIRSPVCPCGYISQLLHSFSIAYCSIISADGRKEDRWNVNGITFWLVKIKSKCLLQLWF